MNNGNGAARKALLAGTIGNFVEWYDFTLYGFFATTISTLFFPKSNPTAALLSTFAIFAVGFIARPLGAVAFGHLGDRIGRRPTLIWAVMLMSAGTVALGLLPTTAQIGTAAPVLLLVCRLVQGFSAGGEYSGSNILVIEHATYDKRGRYAAAIPMGSLIGLAFGALVSMIVTATTTPEQLSAWGWRMPFIAAMPLALIGLYLRLRVEETPVFATLRSEGRIESSPLAQAFKDARKPMLVLAGWTITNAVAVYFLTAFFVSYLTETAGFSKTGALVVELIALVVATVGCAVAGKAIDVVGRKPVAVASAVGLGVWAVPTFVLLERTALLGAALVAALFALFYAGITTTGSLAVVELFPAHVRASASGPAYQFCYAVFGGTAPYVATWMVANGHHLAPGYYLAGLCAVSALVAALGIGNHAPMDRWRDRLDESEQASA